MDKLQKNNYVKCWLQKFGERDNETFNTEVVINDNLTWRISLQYNFDDEGEELKPYNWCTCGFKNLRYNSISDRTEEELDEIINKLKTKKSHY
jgi:hypothetical protein